jgi:catechol 2,3-dioxygenase-like lactoylglutathione lyase family enzyme
MKIKGITWHAVQLEDEQLAPMRTFVEKTLKLPVLFDFPGVVVFTTPNGDLFELYGPQGVPSYQFHPADVAFGFRVDDIAAASAELEAAGIELLGDIVRTEFGYAYRHFRGPDGRVYGLNENPNA